MHFFFIADLVGTFVFAVSGALAARERNFDLFGIFIIAFVTAVGGGTLRDVIIGRTPVFWMKEPLYVLSIFLGALTAILFQKKAGYMHRALILFDTLGIAVFTIIGTEIALSYPYQFHYSIVVAIGMMTACFGGVIRDILCNEIPVIFHKELYATPCLIGSVIFLGLRNFDFFQGYISLIAMFVIVVVRLCAIKYSLQLRID